MFRRPDRPDEGWFLARSQGQGESLRITGSAGVAVAAVVATDRLAVLVETALGLSGGGEHGQRCDEQPCSRGSPQPAVWSEAGEFHEFCLKNGKEQALQWALQSNT